MSRYEPMSDATRVEEIIIHTEHRNGRTRFAPNGVPFLQVFSYRDTFIDFEYMRATINSSTWEKLKGRLVTGVLDDGSFAPGWGSLEFVRQRNARDCATNEVALYFKYGQIIGSHCIAKWHWPVDEANKWYHSRNVVGHA